MKKYLTVLKSIYLIYNNIIIRNNMVLYIIRRLLMMIPMFIGITIICFIVIHLAPGDAAEMRAVTPNFTFSMKRPDDGWNITIEELAKIVKAENQKLTNEFQRRIWSDTTTPAKANIMHYHTLWKRIAAKLGWSYSKEKTR